MGELKDKVILVTGESSCIGAPIVKPLLEEGMKVVGLARRVEKVEELGKGYEDRLFPIKADITNKDDLERVFTWTQDYLGPLHVLINNAGTSKPFKLEQFDIEGTETTINTNLLALTWYTGKAIELMKANNIDGDIININSFLGHYILNLPGMSTYQASKYGVTAFTECIRRELANRGSKIRITSVSPGLVESKLSTSMFIMFPYIKGEDIADAVKFILTRLPKVQVAISIPSKNQKEVGIYVWRTINATEIALNVFYHLLQIIQPTGESF